MVNTPINNTSIINKHNKNSFIRNLIEFQLIKTQIGVNNAVKIKKKREIPSAANKIDPGIHSKFLIA